LPSDAIQNVAAISQKKRICQLLMRRLLRKGMNQSSRPDFAGDGLRPRSSGLRRSTLAEYADPRRRTAIEAATQLVFIARLVSNHVIPADEALPTGHHH
jgi:hypothetical protein